MIGYAAASAAFTLGLVHSLAPGHWLPVVLLAKARRWTRGTTLLGALVAASGHVFLSILVGVILVAVGARLFHAHGAAIEEYAGWGLIAFGLGYAVWSWFNHSHCHAQDHEHHGPDVRRVRLPFAFLFTLGLSPCLTILPTFVAAAAQGVPVLGAAIGGFAVGVVTALVGATLLASFGVMKLDHPFLEHYGDVLTGVVASLMGVAFLLIHTHSHSH
jgi:nickel/cobalt exporter